MTDNDFIEKYGKDQSDNVETFEKITETLSEIKKEMIVMREDLDKVNSEDESTEDESTEDESTEEESFEKITSILETMSGRLSALEQVTPDEDGEDDEEKKKKKKEKKESDDEDDEKPPKDPEKPKQENKKTSGLTEGENQKISFKEALDKHFVA